MTDHKEDQTVPPFLKDNLFIGQHYPYPYRAIGSRLPLASKSNIVAHAERELSHPALFHEDEQIKAICWTISRLFAGVGHSGSSAMFHRDMIQKLLNYENLTPLTSDPGEWESIFAFNTKTTHQNKRNPQAFSGDGGKTYYLLSETKESRLPRLTRLSYRTMPVFRKKSIRKMHTAEKVETLQHDAG